MKRTLILAAVATAVAGQVQARDYISIVGSSTVYPFATVVAERFARPPTSRPRRSNPPVPVAASSCSAPASASSTPT